MSNVDNFFLHIIHEDSHQYNWNLLKPNYAFLKEEADV